MKRASSFYRPRAAAQVIACALDVPRRTFGGAGLRTPRSPENTGGRETTDDRQTLRDVRSLPAARCGGTADARHRAEQADQDRPVDGEDRAPGAGRPADGAGHGAVLQGPQQQDGRPAGGTGDRRHRRQSRRHQDQGAGTDRARPGRHDLRSARRRSSLLAISDYVAAHKTPILSLGRRRGHDAAQAQPVFRARFRHLGAERCIRWPTTRARS